MNPYFTNRNTVRNFCKKDIDDNLIKEILEAAACAPTTGGMQLYSVIVTRDIVMKQRLAGAHFSQPTFVNAPVILTFCADFNRFTKWCRVSNADPGYDNIQSFVAAAFDATILAQQFCTIAEMEGLGTCYLGTTTYNPDMIADALDLPEYVVPVLSVALGYPEKSEMLYAQLPKDRLPVESFIFNEKYPDFSDDTIRGMYAEKESRLDNIKFTKENNKDSLAAVFTDVRYPRANNEIFSTKFVDFLRRQGFLHNNNQQP